MLSIGVIIPVLVMLKNKHLCKSGAKVQIKMTILQQKNIFFYYSEQKSVKKPQMMNADETATTTQTLHDKYGRGK
jgi:hypothetical protein